MSILKWIGFAVCEWLMYGLICIVVALFLLAHGAKLAANRLLQYL